MNKARTHDKIKAAGFSGIEELAEQESRSTNTLRNWDRNNPDMFNEFLIEAAKRKVKK